MACYYPTRGYKGVQRNPETGKLPFVLSTRQGYQDMPMAVPCGSCIGCRLERSRQWAVRIMHEAAMHPENCFLTLTYNQENIPDWYSLDKLAFPKFIRALRKDTGQKIRYFHCGEYGDEDHRPHYHAILFGFDFEDKKKWKYQNQSWAYRSELLEKHWSYGFSERKDVTFGRAQYVARYVVKKVTGRLAGAYYGRRIPEYATMSRRPGIGASWYEKYRNEVYPHNAVVMNGKAMRPPRYYDKLLEAEDPELLLRMKKDRQKWRKVEDETDERLDVRNGVTEARYNLLNKRSG